MPARSTFCGMIVAVGILTFAANFALAEDPKKSDSAEKVSAEGTPELQKRQQTIERALEFIVKDGAKWRTEHGCVSCHHGAMTAWALSEAKSQGYVVDSQALEDAIWQTKSAIVPVFSKPRAPGPPPFNVVNYPALYLGVMSQNLPILSRDEIHRLGAHIALHQEEDGGWLTRPPTGSGVPPTSESREMISILALLAWEPQVSVDSPEGAAARDKREKALKWLRETKSTETTQAIALRLVLDARMGKSGDQLQPSIDRLLGLQRADGGWAQVPRRPAMHTRPGNRCGRSASRASSRTGPRWSARSRF